MTLRVEAKMKRLKTMWLRNQIKPLVAWRAMRELLKNPDDTTQVFHIIEAVSYTHLTLPTKA